MRGVPCRCPPLGLGEETGCRRVPAAALSSGVPTGARVSRGHAGRTVRLSLSLSPPRVPAGGVGKLAPRCRRVVRGSGAVVSVGPQIRRGYPPNLSISISGGRATNQDSPSNGERSGKSSSRQSLAPVASELWPEEAGAPEAPSVEVDLERHVGEGDSPVRGGGAEGRYRLRRVGLFGIAAQSGW